MSGAFGVRRLCSYGFQRESEKDQAGYGRIDKKSKSIPPFDTRVDPGISQQLEVQKILVPVDGMEPEVFGRLMQALGTYLQTNDRARVHLFTRQADYGREKQLLEQARGYLEASGSAKAWTKEGAGQLRVGK